MTEKPTKLEKIVIDNIRRIRREKGISQERLAIFSDTSASYIGLMETYKNIPKLSTIEKIAQSLDVEPIEFFKEHDLPDQRQDENEHPEIKLKKKEKIKNQIMEYIESGLDDILQIL